MFVSGPGLLFSEKEDILYVSTIEYNNHGRSLHMKVWP